MQTKRVGIIGAGPAGITAAYILSKNNIKVDLFEGSDSVGGMAKTIKLWGSNVDIGPHRFFSADTRVNNLWLEVVKDDYIIVDRLTRMYYNNKFYNHPLKPVEVLKNLGLLELSRCFVSYVKYKSMPLKGDDLESWVINSFGKGLYEIFFKSYNAKLWGVDPSNLDKEFALQRIKKVSLRQEIVNFFKAKDENFKTLADQFAYPVGGTGMVYERMKDFIIKSGNNVYLNTRVKKVITRGDVAIGIETIDGKKHHYDNIISSMPISLLVQQLDNVPKEVLESTNKLKFRNTILVYLNINKKDMFKDQWIYVHSKNLKTGRISNFNNFNQIPNDNSVVVLEYWCNDDDSLWKVDNKELIDMAKNDMINSKLASESDIKEGYVYKVHRCYPIYLKGYKNSIVQVQDFLKTIKNLMVIGRYGSYKYNNQDHSILMGLLASDNIINDSNHDLWNINNDYEYQEKSVISKTGLIKLTDDASKQVFW